jgi:alpha-tubulin suppressor-like RCC1 family protein
MRKTLLSLLFLSFIFTSIGFGQKNIAGGEIHSLFQCYTGTAKGCGNNLFGMLGNGTSGGVSISPTAVSSLTGIVAISAGEYHSLFVKGDGTVWSCGENGYGQLGDGTTTQRNSPVQITSLSGIISCAAGYGFSLFLKNDSTVWACGKNIDGQLGDSTFTNRLIPVQVHGVTKIKAIAAGQRHSLFLQSTGLVFSCGQNYRGQLGTCDNYDRIVPDTLCQLINVTAIAAGYEHSVMLKADGTAWTTGFNLFGQIGDGTQIYRNRRTQVTGLSGVIAVDAGGDHTLFVKNDGTAWSCGNNSAGELGNGSAAAFHMTAVQVSGLTGIVNTAGGGHHSIFLKNNGYVYACGDNSSGQLGDSSLNSRTTPVLVGNLCSVGVLETEELDADAIQFSLLNQPAVSELTATFHLYEKLTLSFDICDVNGRLIKREVINAKVGENRIEADLENFESGIYFIRLYNNKYQVQEKFVKI